MIFDFPGIFHKLLITIIIFKHFKQVDTYMYNYLLIIITYHYNI